MQQPYNLCFGQWIHIYQIPASYDPHVYVAGQFVPQVNLFPTQVNLFQPRSICFNLGQFVSTQVNLLSTQVNLFSTWVNLIQPRSIRFNLRQFAFCLGQFVFYLGQFDSPQVILFQPGSICFLPSMSICFLPRSFCFNLGQFVPTQINLFDVTVRLICIQLGQRYIYCQ